MDREGENILSKELSVKQTKTLHSKLESVCNLYPDNSANNYIFLLAAAQQFLRYLGRLPKNITEQLPSSSKWKGKEEGIEGHRPWNESLFSAETRREPRSPWVTTVGFGMTCSLNDKKEGLKNLR